MWHKNVTEIIQLISVLYFTAAKEKTDLGWEMNIILALLGEALLRKP